jgi:hypothetical protein
MQHFGPKIQYHCILAAIIKGLGVRNLMRLSETEKRTVRAAFSGSAPLGLVGRCILVIWFVVSLLIAATTSDYILLASHYGFTRVYREHLHFVSSPRRNHADDFVLSNGEHLGYFERDAMAPIFFPVLFGSFFIGYAVTKRCSKRMNQAKLERTLNAP